MRYLLVIPCAITLWGQRVEAPRFWNDRELSGWATPIAATGVRPGHFSEREYYSAPAGDWVRTYPVYFPGREPEGYWQMIRAKKPEPLITPGARTTAEWIEAGKRVFDEMDVPGFRSYDPKLIAIVRSADEYRKMGGHPQKNGTVFGLRWVVTSQGVGLTIQECAGCHRRTMPDGSLQDGAPVNDAGDELIGGLIGGGIAQFFPGDSLAVATWRQFAVPWAAKDIHSRIKSMNEKEVGSLFSSTPPGVIARFNGSPYFPTKVPDLIGLKDRKFIDHTATHRMRDIGDLMRYGALVGCCDSADFGQHRILTAEQRKIVYSMPDAMMFAVSQYIFSLEPPPNPHLRDARAADGRKIFEREGCAGCHPAPLYTNNKLTLARGYRAPKDHPFAADIMPISVGTDPGGAMSTRKGTGFYKIPSLKGVWYRGRYNHDGSVESLEEWFDTARLAKKPGHEFAVRLPAAEKGALIAFLRTL